jgi:hypothetical protein
MGNIGDTISSGSIPAVGTSGTTYASDLNLFLTEVKARLETLVPKASLAAGPLDLDGEALQNAGYLGLIDLGVGPTTPNNSIQCFDDELYWVSAGGVVKITDGSTLNTAATGGISGDFGGLNPAQLRFVDADQEFYAYDDFGTGTWAYMWARAFDLPKDSTSTTHIRLKAPATLASTFTLTLPDAPVSTKYLKMDSSGNITTAASTQTVAIYGGNFTLVQGATYSSDKQYVNLDAAGANSPAVQCHLNLPINAVVTQLRMRVNKASNASTTLNGHVTKLVDGAVSTTFASATLATNAPGASTVSSASGTDTLVTGASYIIVVVGSSAAPSATDKLYHVEVDYTLPVT